MATLSLGTHVEFDGSAANKNSIAKLTSTKFVIAFVDADDSNKGKVIVGTLSGTTITITSDSASVFENGQCDSVKVSRLDDTHFILAWRDISSSDDGNVMVGSVSGATITLGSAQLVKTSCSRGATVSGIDSTHAIFASGSDDGVYCRLLSISGTTVSLLGSDTKVYNSDMLRFGIDSCKFGAAKILVVTTVYGSYTYWACTVCVQADISGETLTSGNGAQKTTGVSDSTYNIVPPSIDAFDDAYFLVGWGTTLQGFYCDGTTITILGYLSIDGSGSQNRYIRVCCLDSTHWVATYLDIGSGFTKSQIKCGKQSAGTLTVEVDATESSNEAPDSPQAICAMTTQVFAVAQRVTP